MSAKPTVEVAEDEAARELATAAQRKARIEALREKLANNDSANVHFVSLISTFSFHISHYVRLRKGEKHTMSILMNDKSNKRWKTAAQKQTIRT